MFCTTIDKQEIIDVIIGEMRLRIIVTGGAGFVGSHVVDTYIGAGHDVLVLDDLSTGKIANLNTKASFEQVDIRDPDKISSLFKRFSPQIVNHHAAQIDIRRSIAAPIFDTEVNVLGTVNLLHQSVNRNVKGFIFASSGGAIYGETPTPAAEGNPKAPISPYGAAKAAIEYYLFAYMHTFKLETLALRYGNVYGPRQDPRGEAGVISIFAEKLLANEVPTIFGTGKQVRDYIFVKEVARANLLATDCLLSGLPMSLTPDELALNIATGHSLSVNDLFTHLAKITVFSKDPFYAKARPGELMESRLNVTRAKRKLGFTAETSFARGLTQVLAWLRNK